MEGATPMRISLDVVLRLAQVANAAIIPCLTVGAGIMGVNRLAPRIHG